MESGKIIVVANQKGGVAKTSTVRNLSYALAEMGKKVLVVDFDPQYNLTTSFGVLPTQAPYNTGTLITNLLLDESLPDTNEFIQKIDSVDLIPSSRYLTVAEANLLMTPDMMIGISHRAIRKEKENGYERQQNDSDYGV